ncbi:methyl-accepting chemotaxis protein [Anaerovibrio sp.]|uniref:methyl-accepting chemotaxis protein n=1 Tax=Anaerovibrio sp. TaxID=1872532 RepID=UPI003F14AE58
MLQRLFSNFNLTKKLTISFLLLALVPVVIVTALSMNTMYGERMEQIDQHNIYLSRLKAGDMAETFMNQANFMEALSETEAIRSMDKDRMERLLQVAKKDSPTVSSLFVCDTTGQQVARDSGNYVNVADRDYIKAVLQQGKPYAFSDATISKATGKVMIIAAVPVKDENGTIIGAIASTFNMDTLQTLLNENTNMLNDRKEVIYLTDSKGNVMIHPEQKFVETITNWASMTPVQSAASGKATAMEYINGDGTDCLAASAPVGSMGWSLVVENDRAEVMSVLYTAIMQVAVVVLILLIGVLVFARLLAGSFARPMKEMEEKTELMADGDLTVHLDVRSNDEIGHAAAAFNRMARQMNDVMGKIAVAAQQVASGSKNISDAGNMLAKGASTQASSVEELSASIAEITAQTTGNAENATHANELTKEADAKAQAGNKRMEEMLQAMADINESSANIAKIIKVIDEIAFQTNILALNAAVEAARAGQHGKGFAVVAEEVRNLAARSAKAAKETTDIIEKSIDTVNAGTELARGTAEALKSIQESIDRITGLVGGIADASQKQSSALQMLNQGVLQVSNVVQNNSSTAEESAAASVQLSAQADLLQEAVRRFRI